MDEERRTRRRKSSRALATRIVILAAICLDALLYGLIVPFLPERALALGATPFTVGALFATYGIGVVVATYPVGLLTDRLGSRRTLLLGLIGLLLATLLFGFAEDIPSVFPLVSPLTLLFVARAAQGVAAAVTWTAGLALLARQSAATSHAALFAQAGTAMGVGTLLGPPLGGVLYSIGGFHTPFLCVAILAALDGLGRIIFLRDPTEKPSPAEPESRRLRLLRRPRFVLALFAIAAGDLVLTALEPTLPPLFTQAFGLTPLLIGLVFGGLVASFTVAQSVAAILLRHASRPLVLAAGLVVTAVALLAFARAVALRDTVGALATLAVGSAFILIAGLELLTASGEQGFRPGDAPYGAIYAAYNFVSSLGALLGPLASGSGAALLGFRYTFIVLSVPMLVLANCSVVLLFGAPRRTRAAKP